MTYGDFMLAILQPLQWGYGAGLGLVLLVLLTSKGGR